jgi:ABC-2 type transport system permease protein
MRAFLAHTRAEVRMSLRQGEQLLVSLGIPLLLLVFFSLVDVLPRSVVVPGWELFEPNSSVIYQQKAVDSIAPSVLALAIMSTAMVSLGIGTGFERYYKVLKRLGATPLGRPRLILAKISMVLVIETIQLAVLVPTALALGWHPGGRVLQVIPAYLLGTGAFAGLGLLLAGTLKGTVNLAACNGLYLVLLLFGGIMVPLEKLPDPIGSLARLLPSGALSEVMHYSLTPNVVFPKAAWLVLAAWAVALPLAAARFFRWE